MSTEKDLNEKVDGAEETVKDAVQGMDEKAKEAADKAGEAVDKVEEKAKEVAEKAGDTVKEASDKAKEAAEKAKEKAAADAEKAKEKAAASADKAKEAAGKVEEKAKEAGKEAGDKAKEAAGKAKEGAAKAKDKAAKAVSGGKNNTKLIAGIVIAAAAIACIAFFVLSGNNGNKSLYAKIGDYDKYVKVGEYKGLEYTKEKIKVTDKEVKEEIDKRLAAKATTKDSKKGTVKDGDNINISYVGTMNGKKFDGGTADNQTLTIGSKSMIDGFEDGLVGKKVGDTVTLKLKFPKKYEQDKKLQGKPVTFKVTINSKQITETPKYDVKFIKENSEYDNKKDYEASVKKDLKETKETTAVDTAKQTLWSQVVESSEVKKYPKGAIKEAQESIIEQYKQMAESYNMEWDEFLKTYMQSDEKAFKKQAKTYGKNVAKRNLVLYAIADKEKIEVSSKEFKERLKELLKNANMTEKQFKENYNMSIEEYAEEHDFRDQFLMEKVFDFIYKEAKAKEADSKNK